VIQHLLKDDTQVYKQFVENESAATWCTRSQASDEEGCATD